MYRRRERPSKGKEIRHSASPTCRSVASDPQNSTFPLLTVSTTSATTPVLPLVSSFTAVVPPVFPIMALPRVHAFVPFDQGNPLNFLQHHDVPLAALKSLPDFTGESQTTTIDHIRDVASLCSVHHLPKKMWLLNYWQHPSRVKL